MSVETVIRDVYANFFDAIGGICPNTGIMSAYPEKRFATYPYIGSKYGKGGLPKILFVGMDMGRDETVVEDFPGFPADPCGRIQCFEERRMRVIDRLENPRDNKHIRGTCSDAAALLKEKGWQTPFGKSPLSYVALTNFHKFVTRNRHERGNRGEAKYKDRKFIQRDLECKLLVDEVKALEPDIVIFQGIRYRDDKKDNDSDDEYRGLKYQRLKFQDIEGIFTEDRDVLIGSHPSAWPKDFKEIKPWRACCWDTGTTQPAPAKKKLAAKSHLLRKIIEDMKRKNQHIADAATDTWKDPETAHKRRT